MSTITQLEQTLIDIATHCLADVLGYSAKRKQGSVTAEDAEAFEENHVALSTLVQLAHLKQSGLTEDARDALLDIEESETAVLRALVS
ncbi:hypothetical protein [Pseudomonas oryzihabitans]|uniref:Uncharacterized protein n=1 Tax=Pseudomonas oryzihabitans TaxID=47885 RepID=A0ABX3IRU3_9PSED|nr:hypothetical protein [Pseudomonas psychrotolerans]ONN71076.1 hypothetical protein BVL52_11265 [Pseudomonas psychrotolerans]